MIACVAGENPCCRGFATELTAGMTLLNKGLKAGPGGRSSVSIRAHVCRACNVIDSHIALIPELAGMSQ